MTSIAMRLKFMDKKSYYEIWKVGQDFLKLSLKVKMCEIYANEFKAHFLSVISIIDRTVLRKLVWKKIITMNQIRNGPDPRMAWCFDTFLRNCTIQEKGNLKHYQKIDEEKWYHISQF